jgi:broad specificity phosphatase PhoE
MNKIILIRHGEAEHLVRKMTGGWTDLPLTELGEKQAFRTGKELKEIFEREEKQFRITFYSSDLQRAERTARIIVENAGLCVPVIKRMELRELNNGIAKDLSLADAKKIRQPVTEPAIDWVPYPEAESWKMMHQRLASFMDSINTHSDELSIILSHSNAIICIINWWLGFEDDETLTKISYKINPCSITILDRDEWDCRRIIKLNMTCHIKDLEGKS